MIRKLKNMFALSLVILLFGNFSIIEAQDNEKIVNGFIQKIELNNEVIDLHVIDNFGNLFKLAINEATQIGIETQSGERWVGNIKEDPGFVVNLLEESQHSLEPITLTHNGTNISNLVSYESSNIKNNLSYLGASFIFLTILFFGFIFIINNRIKILSNEN
jgi:hypothetical protein|tara:strand:+ start:5086 stop:5568 length:483 start_codon:yes stop_codon:yes gene_type:complete